MTQRTHKDTAFPSLKLKKAPISEVVSGVFFQNLPAYLPAHSGIFWQDVKGDFADIESKEKIFPNSNLPTNIPVFLAHPKDLTRTLLVNNQNGELLQLQNDAFLFNWRKTSENSYPGYEEVYKKFTEYFEKFKSMVEQEVLGDIIITQLQLHYVNHVKFESGVDSEELLKIFPILQEFFSQRKHLGQPESLQIILSYKMPGNLGNLRVSFRDAKVLKTNEPVFLFEIAANYFGRDFTVETYHEWFQSARDEISKCFINMTSEDARNRIWK